MRIADYFKLFIYLLLNCLKGYTKGRLPVQGDALTYNHTRQLQYKTAHTLQNSIQYNFKTAYTMQLITTPQECHGHKKWITKSVDIL